MAQGLKVGSAPWVTAVFDGVDVVHIGGDGAAFAEWVVEQDASAQHLPSLGVVDLLASCVVGLVLSLPCVACASTTVDGWVRASRGEAEASGHLALLLAALHALGPGGMGVGALLLDDADWFPVVAM